MLWKTYEVRSGKKKEKAGVIFFFDFLHVTLGL